MPPAWATAVAPIGPVAIGTMMWRSRGRAHLTVALKARFAFRHDTMMVVTSPTPLATRDRHVDGDPTRSLSESSDMVPYRERADVWLTGKAFAPAGRPVSVSVVRLAVYRHGQALLDKALHVYGERKSFDSEPKPFESLPLTYELAYGGIGFDDNPVGVGADERPLAPSVVDPHDVEAVAGFGPISRYWKLRRRGITTHQRRELEADVPALPDGFDWSYYQAAPQDQRLPFLGGDEWLVLDGMHPSLLRVQTRLPKVNAVARIFSAEPLPDEEGEALAMVGDTLAIDAEQQTCTVTWRGTLQLAGEAQAATMLVAGGIEMHGRTLDWSLAHRNRVARTAKPAPSGERVVLDRSGVTVVSEIPTPGGVFDEIDVPAPRSSEPTLVTEGPPASYRRVSENDPKLTESQEIEHWPSYPLDGGEEVTETKTTEITAPPDAVTTAIDAAHEAAIDIKGVPLAVDTEPGGPPLIDENELPWLEEIAIEPDALDHSEDKTVIEELPHSLSMPPAPLQADDFEQELRGAGATEQDIAALLDWLDDDG